MEILTPLLTLKDWQDAKRAARVNYDHSLSKVVPRKKSIRKSKKTAFLSAFATRKTEGRLSTNLDKREVLSASSHALLEDTQKEPSRSLCQGKERLIQIFISNSVKGALCLQLHPTTSILDLKEIIQDKLGIQQEKQHLVTRKGLELRDAVSLRDYGIQQDTNLDLRLVAGLIGGTKKKHSGDKKTNGTAPSTTREVPKANGASAEEGGDRPPLPRDINESTASRKKTSRKSMKRDNPTNSLGPSPSEKGDSVDEKRRKTSQSGKPSSKDIEPRAHTDSPERQEETMQSTSTSPASSNISKKLKGRKRKSRATRDHGESIKHSAHAEKKDNLEQSLRFPGKGNRQAGEDPKTQSDQHAVRQDDAKQRACVSSASGDIFKKARGRKRRRRTTPSQDEPKRQRVPSETANIPVLTSASGAIPKKSRKAIECHGTNEPQGRSRTQSVSLEGQDKTVRSSKPSPTSDIAHSSRRKKGKGHRSTTSQAVMRSPNAASTAPEVAKDERQIDTEKSLDTPCTAGDIEKTRKRRRRRSHTKSTLQQNQRKRSASSESQIDPTQRPCVVPGDIKHRQSETKDIRQYATSHPLASQCRSGKKTSIEEPKKTPHEKPKKIFIEEPKKTPHEKPKKTSNEKPKKTSNEEPKKSFNDKPKETSHKKPKKTYNKEPKKTSYEEPKETSHEKPKKTSNKELKKTSNEEPNETPIEKPKKTYNKEPKKTSNEKPKKTSIEELKKTSSKKLKNGSNEEPKKTSNVEPKKSSDEEPKMSRQQFGNNVNIQTLQIHGANKSPIIVGTCSGSSIHYGTNIDAGEEHNRRVADKAEKALKTAYSSKGGFVQLIPWVSDDKMHILDIYTELQLEQVCRNEDNPTDKMKSYEEIFRKSREGSPIKRMILTGTAGLGKSTLIDKMAYDWAMGSCPKLGEYKLVFVLKMHALEQTSNFLDAVFDQILDETSIEKSALSSYINANPDEVLILLDGFDELMTTSLRECEFGSILKILKRREGAEFSVIVTTRSSHIDKLVNNTLIEEPVTRVKVLGFSEECIKQYVTKFYSHDLKKAQGLLGVIFSSGALSDLAKSPMLLLLMCILWREESSLPETMSSLYKDAMRYILARKTDNTQEERSNLILEIGKVALDGLLAPKQIFSFPERLFESDVLSLAISAGILSSQRVMKQLDTHNSVMFIHKTFQEYCAAMFFQHLQRTGAEELQTVVDKIDQKKNNISDLDYLLRFCCGDNEACTIIILQIVHKYLHYRYLDLRWLLFSCYFECQSNFIPSEKLIWSVIRDQLHFYSPDKDFVNASIYFLKHVSGDSDGNGNVYLPEIEELRINRCDLQSFDESFGYVLKRMSNIQSLKLYSCSLTASNMKYIVSSLENADELSELELSGNETLSGLAKEWPSKSTCLKRLRKLDMCKCLMKGDDVELLLREMTNVVTLLLSENILGNSASLFGPHLQQMQQLQKLDLSDCRLRGEDAKHIVVAVSSTLIDLNLSKNKELRKTARLWAPYLERLKHLQKLGLGCCSLTGTDVKHVDAISLLELDLSGNCELGGSAGKWFHTLKCMTKLNKLGLGGCNIQGSDLLYLTDLICCLPSIRRCCTGQFRLFQTCQNTITIDLIQPSMTGKDISLVLKAMENMSDFVEVLVSGRVSGKLQTEIWAPSLTHVKNLEKLGLIGCSLKSKNIKHIAKSTRDATKLVKLDLSENQTLGGDAVVWCRKLERLKRLQKIFIKNCCLKGQDMEHMLVSLGKIDHLVELDLSENDQLSGSAELWSHHLKHLANLRTLKLTDCKFQAQDLKSLAPSILDMESLEQCHTGMLDVEKTTKGTSVHVKGCSSLTGKDLAHLLKVMGRRSDLVELKLTDVGNVMEDSQAAIWAPYLKELTHLKRLSLNKNANRGKYIRHIAKCLSSMPSVVELDLSDNKALGGSARLWCKYFKRMKHLRNLNMRSCRLTGEDMQNMAHSLSDNIRQLDLSRNFTLGGSARSWALFLRRLKKLERLILSECSLTGEDITEVAISISSMENCISLSVCLDPLIAHKPFKDESYRRLCFGQTIAGMVLDLYECFLSLKQIARIFEAMGKRNDVVELDLSKNRNLQGSAADWCPSLEHLQHLQKVDLGGNELTAEDVKQVWLSCSSIPTLTEVDLSYNRDLGGSGHVWARHIHKMKQLQKLKIEGSSLQTGDVKPVAKSLSRMSVLVELVLTRNMSLGGCASLWAQHLSKMAHVKVLILRDCSLIGEDVGYIADSVANMPNLVKLDLSDNSTLGDSGACWSDLHNMKYLQNLDLGGCSLVGGDIGYIIESVSAMPALQDLCLSWTVENSCIDAWSNLHEMIHLNMLVLRLNSREDLEKVATSISKMPYLKELHLSCDSKLQGSQAWSHLRKMIHLKKLHLQSSSLKDEDIVHVAAMPSLIELDLSNNDCLTGSSLRHLKGMKQLGKLSLRYCFLNDDDMTSIFTSVNEMPTLRDLDLSMNYQIGPSVVVGLQNLKYLNKLCLKDCISSDQDRESIASIKETIAELIEVEL